VLTYLDAMIDACSVRDAVELERLLAHPLARILTAAARDEVVAIRNGTGDALVAPLRLLRLRHQTAELLRDAPPIADQAESSDVTVVPALADTSRAARAPAHARGPRGTRMVQMELPLSA
jgi:hypothetical protein